jgi:hypothetical protein
MKRNIFLDFSYVFPNVAVDRPLLEKSFAKVHGFIRAFAINAIGCEIDQIDLFNLVDEKGNFNRDFNQYLCTYYSNESTRASQTSIIKTLAEAEFGLIRSKDVLPSKPALGGLVVPEKLLPHMKEIWLALPRPGGAHAHKNKEESRAALPLTNISKEAFKIILAVNERHDVQDAKELLQGHYNEIKLEVLTSIEHNLRTKVLQNISRTAQKLGLRTIRTYIPRLTLDQLPVKMGEELNNFIIRGPAGLAAFDDLRTLAVEFEYKTTKPLSATHVYHCRDTFLAGLAYMDLTPDMGVEDLLRLESRSINIKGREIIILFNPFIDHYRALEKAKEKPGFKQVDYDSSMFCHFLVALRATARFNGEFQLVSEFNKYYRVKPDKGSLKIRKHLKKKRMNPKWIDDEIIRLKDEFDQIVREKTFLTDKRDLKVCLFLAQLVVLRYLGFRQQCLRKCLIGKNIIFNSKSSVTFHYEPGEIKNDVMIDETLSSDLHDGLDEIMLLIDVLVKYKFQVLDTIRAKQQDEYKKKMGDAFFGKAVAPWGLGLSLVESYPAGQKEDSLEERAKKDLFGSIKLGRCFIDMAYELMDFSHLKDFQFNFNPHFLRGVCCDWMRKVLHWTWEEITKALGDTEETLKREYYDEGKKVSDATDAFARSSRERKEARKDPRYGDIGFDSMKVLNTLQESLKIMGNELKGAKEQLIAVSKEGAEWKAKFENLEKIYHTRPAST